MRFEPWTFSATTMTAILRANTPVLAMILGAVVLIAATGTGGVMTQQSGMGCTDPILSLSPCLSYMLGPAKPFRPSINCCTVLATVITSDAECLCQLFASNDFLGFPINQTIALSLPAACNLFFPRQIAQCTSVFPSPSVSAVDVPENAPTPMFRESHPDSRRRRPPSPHHSRPPRPPPPRHHSFPPFPPFPPLPTVPAGSPDMQNSHTSRDMKNASVLSPHTLFGIFWGSIFTGILTVGSFL